jgi:hypothetical protein
MTGIVVHGNGMNDDYDGPRISPAEFLSERPERNQRAAENPCFSVSPSFLLTSMFEVGVFDWTDAAVLGNVFLGCFESRRLKTSCFKTAWSASCWPYRSEKQGRWLKAGLWMPIK